MHKDIIFIHHIAVVEDILGPGKRLVFWLTGCPFTCPNCIEPKLRRLEYGSKYSVDSLYREIMPVLSELKAITFSGGEPLFQREAMLNLFELLPSDVDVMLYTGMTTEIFTSKYREFYKYIDIVVTEPFVTELHSDNLWRGSSNQQILSPTGKHKKKITEWMLDKSKGIKVHFEKNELFIYGIPIPEMLKQVKSIIKEKGIYTKEK